MLDALLSGDAVWFGVPALAGTLVFTLRIVLMLVGGDSGHDLDAGGGDVGHGHDALGDAHGDPDTAFTWLSFQGVAAFAMGFGWGGLGALHGAGWAMPTAVGLGVVAGLGMTWLLGWLLKALADLQTSGNIAREQALGAAGDVYVTVPAHGHGRGQVRVVLGQRQRIYDAIADGEALPTGSRVRVVAVDEDGTLRVVPD